MLIIIVAAVFFTSLISGFLGMAGGVILMGVYVALLPITSAMVLHGATQASANGFRCWLLRQHIRWEVFVPYTIGALISVTLFFLITIIPEKPWVFIGLGTLAISNIILPKDIVLDLSKAWVSGFCGVIVTACQLFIGVSGALLDLFYVNSNLTRYEIIATKALTQTLSHCLKFIYYLGLLVLGNNSLEIPYWLLILVIPIAFLGTSIGKKGLGFVSESQFRLLSRIVLLGIGCTYVYRGTSLLMLGSA